MKQWLYHCRCTGARNERGVAVAARRRGAPPGRVGGSRGADFGVRLRNAESEKPLRAWAKCGNVFEYSSGERCNAVDRKLREIIGAERRGRLGERGATRLPTLLPDTPSRARWTPSYQRRPPRMRGAISRAGGLTALLAAGWD